MHTKSILVKSFLASVFYTGALIFDLFVVFAQLGSHQNDKVVVSILLLVIATLSIGFIVGGLIKGRIYILARHLRSGGYTYKTATPVAFTTDILYRLLVAVLAIVGLLIN